jgi:hypothetical protein
VDYEQDFDKFALRVLRMMQFYVDVMQLTEQAFQLFLKHEILELTVF